MFMCIYFHKTNTNVEWLLMLMLWMPVCCLFSADLRFMNVWIHSSFCRSLIGCTSFGVCSLINSKKVRFLKPPHTHTRTRSHYLPCARIECVQWSRQSSGPISVGRLSSNSLWGSLTLFAWCSMNWTRATSNFFFSPVCLHRPHTSFLMHFVICTLLSPHRFRGSVHGLQFFTVMIIELIDITELWVLRLIFNRKTRLPG